MPGLRSYADALLLAETIVLLGLLVRLVATGLQRVYPFFFSFVAAETIQLLVPYFTSYKSVWYGYAYVATESVIVCLYALIVLELYAKVFGSLTGIAALSRRYIKLALCIAILASLLLLILENTPETLVGKFLIFRRAIVSSLLLFVFLMTAFLVYFPIPLNRNVLVYFIGYAFYFLGISAALFARNIGVTQTPLVNTILLVITTSSFLSWILFLNRDGERKAVTFGHRWDRGDEARLLQQLESINAALLRTSRK